MACKEIDYAEFAKSLGENVREPTSKTSKKSKKRSSNRSSRKLIAKKLSKVSPLVEEALKASKWPESSLKVNASKLAPNIACAVCKGFLYNATTAVDCMHSFCKKCIVDSISRGVKTCPVCSNLLHPSNAIHGLKEDHMLQDLVYKLLPHVNDDEKRKEEQFYREKNIPQVSHDAVKKPLKQRPVKRWISLELKCVGVTDELCNRGIHVKELKNRFLKIPEYTTVRDIQKYLKLKLELDEYTQCMIFFDLFLLHEDLSMDSFQTVFLTPDEMDDEEDLVLLLHVCFAAKGCDYFNYFSRDRLREHELDWPCYGEVKYIFTADTASKAPSIAASDVESHTSNSNHSNHIAEDVSIYHQDDKKPLHCIDDSSTVTEPKLVRVYICCLCQKEQQNIFCHLKVVHKLDGDKRRQAAQKCDSKYRYND